MYEEYLKSTGVAATELETVEARVAAEVEAAAAEALASRESNMPPPESATDNVYAP